MESCEGAESRVDGSSLWTNRGKTPRRKPLGTIREGVPRPREIRKVLKRGNRGENFEKKIYS